MATNKTTVSELSVDGFLDGIADSAKRDDARAIAAMMARVSGEPPRMWGPSMVGFGRYRYRYDSGREGEAMRVGFSPRAAALTLYMMDGFPEHAELLARLGKHSTGKSCLYVKRLADVDGAVLEALVAASVAHMDERYPR